MMPFKKFPSFFFRFCDPFLLLGIVLLFVVNYTGKWLTYHATHEWRTLILAINWLAGLGSAIGIIVGVIRPVVRALLEGQFLSAGIFYGVFWFVLCLPVVYLQFSGGDAAPAGGLYWGFLLILFCVVNVLIGTTFLIGKSIQRR